MDTISTETPTKMFVAGYSIIMVEATNTGGLIPWAHN